MNKSSNRRQEGAYCKQRAKMHPGDNAANKTLYLVHSSFGDIDEVACHSETKTTVTVTQVRMLMRNSKCLNLENQVPHAPYTVTERKQSSDGFFVDTLQEAIDLIRDENRHQIELARKELDRRIDTAGNVNVELIKLLKQKGLWEDEIKGEPQ